MNNASAAIRLLVCRELFSSVLNKGCLGAAQQNVGMTGVHGSRQTLARAAVEENQDFCDQTFPAPGQHDAVPKFSEFSAREIVPLTKTKKTRQTSNNKRVARVSYILP